MRISKLGCCIILFRPDDSVFENVASYLPAMDYIVLVDNSDNPGMAAGSTMIADNIEYIAMGNNAGIARALNVGCRALIENGCVVALTMDQDSEYPIEDHDSILSLAEALLDDFAIVGLNYNHSVESKASSITVVKYWITSGNFLRLDDYVSVGGFNDDLFIDYVDIEFGHRLYEAGKKICFLTDYSLKHSIGDPIEVSVFGRTFYAMNHRPIRYYYRFRNSRYLYETDRRFYGEKFRKEIFVNIPKLILFEPDKKEKLRMALLGFKDGRAGNLGDRFDGEQSPTKFQKIGQVLERSLIFKLDGIDNRLYTDIYWKHLQKLGVHFTGRPNYISSSAYLDGQGYGLITIGKDVVISREAMLLTHDYSIETALHSIGLGTEDRSILTNKGITIGDNSFIGARVSLLPGTRIGRNCIIGACSVVKGEVPDGSVLIGAPSRRIISTTEELGKRLAKGVEGEGVGSDGVKADKG